ncbi:MAG: DUF2970 domain-containing protein [Methylococcaceae bacterium]|nr:DUF2970 domain-containing protein [Methylococcaceae bacterium]
MSKQDEDTRKGPNLLQVIGSVLAAGFGVQSNKNRERDFKQVHPGIFVAVGIVATILFILTLYGIVRLVIG